MLDRFSAALMFEVGVLGYGAIEAGRLRGMDPAATYFAVKQARAALRDWIAEDRRQRPASSVPDVIESQREHPQAAQEDEPMTPLLLTVKQAAEMLGISRTTLYELMKAGEIRSVKRGASRRIPRQVVYDYVDRLIADGQGVRTAGPPVS